MSQRYPVAAKDQYVTQSALDLRVPVGAIPGQVLTATAIGGKWSWADKHPSNYYNTY